jgi:hypothetical protein
MAIDTAPDRPYAQNSTGRNDYLLLFSFISIYKPQKVGVGLGLAFFKWLTKRDTISKKRFAYFMFFERP